MLRDFSRQPSYQKRLKSKRAYQYLREQAVNLRRRVFLYLSLIILIYLVYFLFYSDNFKITKLNVVGDTTISSQEVEQIVWHSLAKNSWLIFPQDNYFLLSKRRLRNDFQKEYSLTELIIDKQAPHTLNIKLTERVGQLLWVTKERIFLLNLEGQITKEIPARELVNIDLPVIYDNSNTEVKINEQILGQGVVDLILEIYQNFDRYEFPLMEIDSFRIDSPKANFVKLVTKQGFEIHLNTALPLEKQFYKLKRSLEEGKIDLTNVKYINLRIENQVIYK